MAEVVMTIIWNIFQKDCQIVMCDVAVDWPQLPSEYSSQMSPNSLFWDTLYFLICFLNTLPSFQSSICCLSFTFSIVFVSQAYSAALLGISYPFYTSSGCNIPEPCAWFLALLLPFLVIVFCRTGRAFEVHRFTVSAAGIWSVTLNNLLIVC